MIRTQIQLTEQQVGKLKKIADTHRQSMAEVVRQAIDSFTATKAGLDLSERKNKAIAVAGKFHSGAKDLSEKHNSYFTEALNS